MNGAMPTCKTCQETSPCPLIPVSATLAQSLRRLLARHLDLFNLACLIKRPRAMMAPVPCTRHLRRSLLSTTRNLSK